MIKTIHDPVYITIIKQLQLKRHRLQLRQVDVAKRLGVSRNWVSKIERRDIRLDVLQFNRLCRVLDLEPADLLRPAAVKA